MNVISTNLYLYWARAVKASVCYSKKIPEVVICGQSLVQVTLLKVFMITHISRTKDQDMVGDSARLFLIPTTVSIYNKLNN